MNQPTSPTAGAIVGIERQRSNIVLAIRDGDQQLAVTLTPRRASLILARLSYATAEALLEQEKDAAALAAAAAGRLQWRTHIDDVEISGKVNPQAAQEIERMATKLTHLALQRAADPTERARDADRNR